MIADQHLRLHKSGLEMCVDNSIPARFRNQVWRDPMFGYEMQLPQGSIEKLIGRKLNWEDEPVEI